MLLLREKHQLYLFFYFCRTDLKLITLSIITNKKKYRRKSTEPKPGFFYAVRQAQVNINFYQKN